MTPAQQVEAPRRDELNIGLLSMPWFSTKGEFAMRIVKGCLWPLLFLLTILWYRALVLKLADILNKLFVIFLEDQFSGRPELLEYMFNHVSVLSQVTAKSRCTSELLGLIVSRRGVAFAPYS